jgi:hypothetical protein
VTAGINLANREHFRVQLDPTHDDLFISKPMFGQATRVAVIQFTRKLLHPDGTFAGVVQVSLDASELSRSYEAAETGNGYVMLAGTDDRIIRASAPLSGNMIGHTIDDPERNRGKTPGGAEFRACADAAEYDSVWSCPHLAISRTFRVRTLKHW